MNWEDKYRGLEAELKHLREQLAQTKVHLYAARAALTDAQAARAAEQRLADSEKEAARIFREQKETYEQRLTEVERELEASRRTISAHAFDVWEKLRAKVARADALAEALRGLPHDVIAWVHDSLPRGDGDYVKLRRARYDRLITSEAAYREDGCKDPQAGQARAKKCLYFNPGCPSCRKGMQDALAAQQDASPQAIGAHNAEQAERGGEAVASVAASPEDRAANLLNALADSVEEASDEEILEEARLAGRDPAKVKAEVQATLRKAAADAPNAPVDWCRRCGADKGEAHCGTAAARTAVVEEAAKLIESKKTVAIFLWGWRECTAKLAAEIRALAGSPTKAEGPDHG